MTLGGAWLPEVLPLARVFVALERHELRGGAWRRAEGDSLEGAIAAWVEETKSLIRSLGAPTVTVLERTDCVMEYILAVSVLYDPPVAGARDERRDQAAVLGSAGLPTGSDG
jgi:hypothetical protein